MLSDFSKIICKCSVIIIKATKTIVVEASTIQEMQVNQ